jgi:arabinosaccharide transport system substrate-binding protein
MNFHLGKPILVMLIIALLCGATILLRPSEAPRGELTVWVFADAHYKSFQPLVEKFGQQHHCKVNLQILSGRALAVRLNQLFMADPHSDQIPDVVEMEISLVGRFFRPPVQDVGFVPLNDPQNNRLKTSGLYDKIVESRFAPWSKEGAIFGVPHDVHPTTIVYRDDLFREAGVDLAQAKTWPQFHEACLKFKNYWRGKGYLTRHAVELTESSADDLQKILLQRGINAVDNYGNLHLNDPRVAETLAFYAQMVAGPKKVSVQTQVSMVALSKDLTEGNICALITPDWRYTYVKRYGANVSGTMRMMPMPVFDLAVDKPTSTWGGTMMAITKACKNPDLAWELVQYLYFSKDGFDARRKYTEILPPIKEMWADPVFHQPDPFLGGQKGQELYTELAPLIPPRYVTPATGIVGQALNDAVVEAVAYINTNGTDDLEPWCARRLADIQSHLESRMKQWRFEQ